MSPEEEIIRDFPNIDIRGFKVTSRKDYRYNCIAWAAGDEKQWWQPSGSPFFWLRDDKSDSLENYIKSFNILGYKEESESSEFEIEFEKIALYVNADGLPSHAARQKDDGFWTSKLGEDEDIQHKTPECLEGAIYGKLKIILKRPRKNMKIASKPEDKTSAEFENFKKLAKNVVNVPKKEVDNLKEQQQNKSKKKADN